MVKNSLIDTKKNIFDFDKIEHKTLSDLVTEKIRKNIIIGKIPQGYQITEQNFSNNLGVSRMVIREAIIRLIKEGLLVKEKNKHTKVIKFSKNDISDLFDLRIALEICACNNYLKLGLKDFELLKERSRLIDKTSSKVVNQDLEVLIKLDFSFHELLINNSENQKLIYIWNSFSGQIFLLLYEYVVNKQQTSKKGIKPSYDHNEIIDALKKKDKYYLQEIITKHIDDTKDLLLKNY